MDDVASAWSSQTWVSQKYPEIRGPFNWWVSMQVVGRIRLPRSGLRAQSVFTEFRSVIDFGGGGGGPSAKDYNIKGL